MQISAIALTEFRNFDQLNINLPAGLIVVHGENAQGKSNIIEAAYMLAISKSYRSHIDRDLITSGSENELGFTLVQGTVNRGDGVVEIGIGIERMLNPLSGEINLSKHFRVNGVNKRASEIIGHLNAVLFSPNDIDLVYGTPQIRRRYLDVLISQIEPEYLRSLQRYQRILTQRNALLRSIRDGTASKEELEFWDDALCLEGANILSSRYRALLQIAPVAEEVHQRMTQTDSRFSVEYLSLLEFCGPPSHEDLRESMLNSLEMVRNRERILGSTLVGPHRDDIRLSLNGLEMARYASRGQARISTLSLKLAEGQFFQQRRGEAPVVLLDDALSELDATRRRLVLEEAMRYPQSIVTTADLDLMASMTNEINLYVHIAQGKIVD